MIDEEKDEAIERVRFANDPLVPVVVIREHLIRYIMAMDSVVGKDVLDIACGTGYGMYLMSYLAKSVSGYDYSEEAINEAKTYPYKCDSCLEIRDLEEDKPLSNHKHEKFDVITCFETIEHVSNPEILLKNIKEVINEHGIIYISTPNDIKHTDNNKWHKVHFDFYTLYQAVSKVFGDIEGIKAYGSDQWGVDDNVTKPYTIIKIEL